LQAVDVVPSAYCVHAASGIETGGLRKREIYLKSGVGPPTLLARLGA
jgi:hypothetical protein